MTRTPRQPSHPIPFGAKATLARVASLLSVFTVLVFLGQVPARAQVPGPEIFAKTPTTSLELWEAIDYLVKTDQAPKAVPYIKTFLKNKPDDASLIKIRDSYGYGSILQLQDYPSTRASAAPIVQLVIDASRRVAADPARVKASIKLLSASPAEQRIGVERLREVGPDAVPAILEALKGADLKPTDRDLILKNLGRLDRSAVPALIPVLEAKDESLAAKIAHSLARIGDPRSIPWLTIAASSANTPAAVRAAAAEAIELLTRLPFAAQPKTPATLLVEEARRYQTHAIQFPGDTVTIWAWSADDQNVVPRQVSKSEAEAILGGKLAKAALALEPSSDEIKAVVIGLDMEKAIERAGFSGFSEKDPSGIYQEAIKSGSVVLGLVLKQAIANRNTDLATYAAKAYGEIAKGDPSTSLDPLIRALAAPGRRARFAAAKVLVELEPLRPFAGSSLVVPALAQFATPGPLPKAVVIDGNLVNGSQVVSFFKTLGYDTILAGTGNNGFREAAESADVELVAIEVSMVGEGWRLHDTIANLRNDARTANLPIYLLGPLWSQDVVLHSLNERFPGLKMIVSPLNPESLKEQMEIVGGVTPLPKEERLALAKEAVALLVKISENSASPFVPDLQRIEPKLALALNDAAIEENVAKILGRIPDPNAQRGLASVVIDPSHEPEQRLAAATQLAKAIRKFGPMIDAKQESNLLEIQGAEPDSKLKTAVAEVIEALKRSPRLRAPSRADDKTTRE